MINKYLKPNWYFRVF